jgi:hypothetical protein
LNIVSDLAAPFKFSIKKLSSETLWLLALGAAWIGTTTVAFYIKSTQLLIGLDGGYMLNLAQRQFAWRVPVLWSSMDWFQGLGDTFFAVNFRLLPAFIVGSQFTNITAAKVAIFEVVLCELSLAIVLFGISLGVSRVVSIAAAVATCVTFLPFAHPTLIYGILALIPHMGSLIAATLLAGAAFLQYGRRSWQADLPYALIVFAILGWSILVSITIILLAAPFLLLCAVSGTIAAASPAERRCKIGLFICVSLFMTAGPVIYFVSTIFDTAAVTFHEELANDLASLYFTSILFHWRSVGPVGPVLMISGIAGAAIAALDRTNRTLRVFAITLLTYLGSRFTFATLIIVFDFWRGPAALYFELFVIPLYAIFAALFWGRMLDMLWRKRGWILPGKAGAEIRIIGTGIVVVLALAAITKRTGWGFPYPPSATPITAILTQETGLQPGSPFRGRTANMIGRSIDHGVDWLTLHGIDANIAAATGNELRLVGLHYFGISGLFQYGPTISPFLYALTSRLLGLPGDKQMRNVIVLRKLDPRILAMLGVRFVITDRAYGGNATLRASIPINDRTLLLYEIAKPNLGDYSPTIVHKMDTATEIVTRLADQNFEPTREIITDIRVDSGRLVSARHVRLSFLGASLRLQADSDKESILLVPLEYSRCLDAETDKTHKPMLFRANLLETGILFSGNLDVTLSIRTGPFLNPTCRLRDLFDALALHVGEIPSSAIRAPASGG